VLGDPAFAKLSERIMFGTDFMIVLMWGPSYNDYLAGFLRTGDITGPVKVKMCNENPARFLFGSE
jgi:predicted TIM-barrel fold metal-dependent hydrolase